ncbi:GNAT family N-acetyltransferase [Cellulomonas sp. ACRRI]|uniref:GNAT family N-acetyltransferase n=1 Tax=Cellulomonas sp. ACRRI TaxID=2918188 RepID=UPI001EF2117E|nr:GNAT family N-acetyltransferase [Cellulomonas sp. ACRRI]MCG7286924.1 GNAT family N-acetyltransferase [Cellulomonas sp. ACRRI]
MLRPWTVDDAPALRAAVAGDADLVRQTGGADLSTDAAAAAHIRRHLAPHGPRSYALAVAVDGLAVGNVGIGAVDEVHATAWVSYWLAATHRGRGLAVAALVGASSWAVRELGTFRLELGHRVNNPASCRVATRAGYPAEGVERAKLRYGAEWFDVETHARLATDPAPGVAGLPVR